MKVYYKIKDFEFEDIKEYDFNSFATNQMRLLMEKIKYQVMWSLRSIENEIADEGGIILILDSGRIETKGFIEELTYKIKDLILAEYS